MGLSDPIFANLEVLVFIPEIKKIKSRVFCVFAALYAGGRFQRKPLIIWSDTVCRSPLGRAIGTLKRWNRFRRRNTTTTVNP